MNSVNFERHSGPSKPMCYDRRSSRSRNDLTNMFMSVSPKYFSIIQQYLKKVNIILIFYLTQLKENYNGFSFLIFDLGSSDFFFKKSITS